MITPSRRRFLTIIGGTLAAQVGTRLLPRSSAARPTSAVADTLPQATRTARALGSEVTITAKHQDRQLAQTAVEDAFAELELVEELMSIYRPTSQLSQLNRKGVLKDAHPYLRTVLAAARKMSQRTDGAFDVTVQPLWSVYREAQRAGRLPTAERIATARNRIDWRNVELNAPGVVLRGHRTEITLNGIAQGFAADRVRQVLIDAGVRHALIDTGEIGSVGNKDHQTPWTVGIQHPRQPDAFVALASLKGRSLATSGDYETTFSDDYRHHHLFHPRTGESALHLSSVSVVSPSATTADALSTAVFVLGPEDGLQLVADTPHADALLVTREGRLLATPGFPLQKTG